MSLIVAIDFTGSNGDPRIPGTLHHIDTSNRGILNQYQQAILAVGSVLEYYDADKKYPVFGFGARIRLPDGQFSPVQHCFPIWPQQPLGQDPQNPLREVLGVSGILDVSDMKYFLVVFFFSFQKNMFF